jgi:hypothetical protein
MAGGFKMLLKNKAKKFQMAMKKSEIHRLVDLRPPTVPSPDTYCAILVVVSCGLYSYGAWLDF